MAKGFSQITCRDGRQRWLGVRDGRRDHGHDVHVVTGDQIAPVGEGVRDLEALGGFVGAARRAGAKGGNLEALGAIGRDVDGHAETDTDHTDPSSVCCHGFLQLRRRGFRRAF